MARRGVHPTRKRLALVLAGLSDGVQWLFVPVLSEGALSPLEIGLDALTALLILVVVGFQWRLAIALIAELVPGLDLFPTWTAVVLSLPTANVEESAPTQEHGSRTLEESGAARSRPNR
jgi:hypothetical protein